MVACSDHLIGTDGYQSWSDWTQEALRRIGKQSEVQEDHSSYEVFEALNDPLAKIDAFNERSSMRFARLGD